jgi:hypothetical protein
MDPESGHERWAVYRAAMEDPNSWRLLGEAVQLEPDAAMAMSVVLTMLEKLPAERRGEWVDKLSSDKDLTYARRRSQELRVLDGLSGGVPALSDGIQFDASWSVWLQLRLAEAATDESLLLQLSELGVTKRVRNAAISRLRVLESSR